MANPVTSFSPNRSSKVARWPMSIPAAPCIMRTRWSRSAGPGGWRSRMDDTAPTTPTSVAPERRTWSQKVRAEKRETSAARPPTTSAVASVEKRALTWYSGRAENMTSSAVSPHCSILMRACSRGNACGSTAPLAGPVVPEV